MQTRLFKSKNWFGNSFGFYFYKNKFKNKAPEYGMTLYFGSTIYGIAFQQKGVKL